MHGLILREEFRGRRLKGTAIELANANNTGATQFPASDFLEITYPSTDLLKAIEAVGPDQGRPLVFLGDRGQGKSHLEAVLYHALTSPEVTATWLKQWAAQLGDAKIASLPLRKGMAVIGESLHRQRYKYLWDLLFQRHPQGDYIKGKWAGQSGGKTDVPSDTLILELLKSQPTALILDELQTWFDGLTDSRQAPLKTWAFNFIQILSEIAKEHPELLVLVVSVRDGSTDAYQQIYRVNPVVVDFKGPYARRDRQRLLLHRLFENRLQVPDAQIEKTVAAHVSEYLRLANVAASEHERIRHSFTESWPFAPHMLQLLEDQVLIATDAQETRDLIRILADLYKQHGATLPVLTAAEFRVDDDQSAITTLLDSVSNQHHRNLREKAQRNLEAVREAVPNHKAELPHLSELVGSLWLRSLAVEKFAGAEPEILQIDITRSKPEDDNQFQVELSTIVDNSFNIHKDGNRLVFREAENPQAKLMATARNDKLFLDGSDIEQLAREIRYVLGGGDDVATKFRVIVLRKNWLTTPWDDVDPEENPNQWDDRIPLIVLPEEPDKIHERLGKWLREHVQKGRNALRFLLPRQGSANAFLDRDLIIYARAVLKAKEWSAQGTEYKSLHSKFERELLGILKTRFDRFAIPDVWSFTESTRCKFHIVAHKAQGSKIPEAVDEVIRENLFLPEDFEELAIATAEENKTVAALLRMLQEPRPNEKECIPWVGETLGKEKVIRLCARGKIAINLRGIEYLQRLPGEDEELAWKRMRGRLGTGKHLDETFLLLPQTVPVSAGVSTSSSQGTMFEGNGGSSAGNIKHGAGDGGQPPAGSGVGSTAGMTGVDTVPVSIFSGPTGVQLLSHSSSATSPLNLLGKTESWGIKAGTQIRDLSLKVDRMTGAQLQKLLKNLPEGLTYEIDLQKEEL